MGMTERDRKVLAVVVVLLVLGGFWFFVVGKKRSAIKEANKALTSAQASLAQAKAAENQARIAAKVKPAAYSKLLRLGKAIPVDSDFQSLLVQINNVTDDSNVNFLNLAASEPGTANANGATGETTCDQLGASGGASAPAASPATGPTGSTAQTFVGRGRDKAQAAVATSQQEQAQQEAASKAIECSKSPTLTDITAKVAGLQSQTLTLTFSGSFFNLQSVFDGIYDLVEVHNGRVNATGRLLDINQISLSVESFPSLTASVIMTAYQQPASAATSEAASQGAQTSPAPTPAPASAVSNADQGAGAGGAE
jgi:hypothetical protein